MGGLFAGLNVVQGAKFSPSLFGEFVDCVTSVVALEPF
jgi:hypothetical protein